MNEMLILGATFIGVMLLSTVVIGRLASRSEVSSRLAETAAASASADLLLPGVVLAPGEGKENDLIRHYYKVIRNDANSDSLPNRLIRAGFFSERATAVFQVIRAGVAFAVFVGIFALFDLILVSLSKLTVTVIAMMAAAFVFFVVNVVLERMGVAKEKAYRRLFPDFMDMLIVCVDAGLSIEAAADRVAKEFMSTSPDFGIHLSIMMLEVRGGRRLRDSLANLADRLRIEEAKSLAVLVRQSEELGSSVTKSLRVYSKEMREMRILRAEEKANALPIKMLFPLATFLFPMSLIIVLVPIVMRVLSMLVGLKVG